MDLKKNPDPVDYSQHIIAVQENHINKQILNNNENITFKLNVNDQDRSFEVHVS